MFQGYHYSYLILYNGLLFFKKLTCSFLSPQRLSAINQGRKYPARQLPSKMCGLLRASLGERGSKPLHRAASEGHQCSACHWLLLPRPTTGVGQKLRCKGCSNDGESHRAEDPHARTHSTLQSFTQAIPQKVPLRTLLVSEQLLHIPTCLKCMENEDEES